MRPLPSAVGFSIPDMFPFDPPYFLYLEVFCSDTKELAFGFPSGKPEIKQANEQNSL